MNSLTIRRMWRSDTNPVKESKSPAMKRKMEAKRKIEELAERKRLDAEFNYLEVEAA